MPHISAAGITARVTDPAQHTDEQAAAAAMQDTLIEELLGGLDVTTVIPELTMAPHAPALAALLPMHETSMANDHERARELAATIADGTTAAA